MCLKVFFEVIISILHFFKEYLFKRERVFLNQQRRHGVQLLFVLLRVAAERERHYLTVFVKPLDVEVGEVLAALFIGEYHPEFAAAGADIVNRAVEDYPLAVDKGDMVADVGQLMQIVRGDDNAAFPVRRILNEHIIHKASLGGVEAVEALVKQQYLGQRGHTEYHRRLALHSL